MYLTKKKHVKLIENKIKLFLATTNFKLKNEYWIELTFVFS